MSAINVKFSVGEDNIGLAPTEVNGVSLGNETSPERESAIFCFEDLDDNARKDVVDRIASSVEVAESNIAYYSRNWLVRKREIVAGALILAATAAAEYLMVQTGYTWHNSGFGIYAPEVVAGLMGYGFGISWLADGAINIGYSREELKKNSDKALELNMTKTLAMGWTALSDSRVNEHDDFKALSVQEIQSWSNVEEQLQALRETM